MRRWDRHKKYPMNCGILSAHNLAYPQWHPVNCFSKVKADVLCAPKQKRSKSELHKKERQCKIDAILFRDYCYRPTRKKPGNVMRDYIKTIPQKLLQFKHIIDYIKEVNTQDERFLLIAGK